MSALWARNSCGLVAADAGQPQAGACRRASRPAGPGGRRGGGRRSSWKLVVTSSQQVAQGGRQLLLGRDRDERVVGHELEQLLELVDRQHVGDVGALRGLGRGGDLGQLAVLGGELGGGRDLHALGLLERALGEGGEPGQALDLDVEQLAANRALLGGGVDVEDVAADGELAALLDLVDALVAAGDELRRDLVEVEQAALLDREAVRAQRRVGDLLGERRGRGDQRRRAAPHRRGRRARRCAGRPGAAAGRDGTRSACRGPGRSAPGGARGRPSGRRRGRAPRGRRPATTSAGRSGSESSSEASRYGRRLAETKARCGSARAASASAVTFGSSWAYLSSDLSMRSSRPGLPRGLSAELDPRRV